MIPPAGPIEPGTSARVVVVVRNNSIVVDSYRLEVLGADHWITPDPAELSLFPGEEGTGTLVVRPPRSATVAAGTHRVGVRVTSTSTGIAVVEETDIVVSSFDAVSLRLRPATARARRRARFEATVTNEGNTGRRFWFDADDDDDLLAFKVRPPHAHFEPGESRVVRIGATFLGRPGPGDRIPVSVEAGNDAISTSERATVAVRSSAGLRAFAVAAALAVVATIAVMSGRDGTPNSSATVANLVTTTEATAPTLPPTTAPTVAPTTSTEPPTTAPSPTTTIVMRTTTTEAQEDPESDEPPATTTTTSVAPRATTTTTTTKASPITTIRFDTPTPTGRQRDILLVGDEFADKGVTLLGAPTTSAFCPTATRVALLASNQFGAPTPFLTTTTGTDLHECNSVPLGIRFKQPVKRVKLTVWGASVGYSLTAHNVKGAVVASATITPKCCVATTTVEVKGSLITDVTFGLDKAITAVTQIEYEV
jgi:hypothetical protein